jgi:hypothetical protein
MYINGRHILRERRPAWYTIRAQHTRFYQLAISGRAAGMDQGHHDDDLFWNNAH